MVLQYTAIGIQSDAWTCQARADYKKNLKYVADSILIAVEACKLDLPVRLVTLAEGALGGWTPWKGKGGHIKTYKELAPEIPGEETDFLGQLCKEMNFYLLGQMQAKDPELMEERVFNSTFIISPEGKIIHKHHKTAFYPKEEMTAPSDIWDRYIEKYGDDPIKLFEALYPVARTEIGNIGTLICAEGNFPEAARGLALNGAEIIWRGGYLEPWIGNHMWEIQNRAHAIFNTCYVIAPNLADIYGRYVPPEHRSSFGGSHMIDYRGNIVSQCFGSSESYVSTIIDIDGLRDFRIRGTWQNLVKDLRIEEYKVIYDAMMAKGGIYPRNLCMEEPQLIAADLIELRRYLINRMVELGIYTAPDREPYTPYTIGKEVLKRIERARKRR